MPILDGILTSFGQYILLKCIYRTFYTFNEALNVLMPHSFFVINRPKLIFFSNIIYYFLKK